MKKVELFNDWRILSEPILLSFGDCNMHGSSVERRERSLHTSHHLRTV